MPSRSNFRAAASRHRWATGVPQRCLTRPPPSPTARSPRTRRAAVAQSAARHRCASLVVRLFGVVTRIARASATRVSGAQFGTGAERFGVGEDGVDLPLLAAWTGHPHLVLC